MQKFLDWLKSLFKKRETITLDLCAISTLLINQYCNQGTFKRRYYKQPKPGEPDWTKIGTCSFHKKQDPVDPLPHVKPGFPKVGVVDYAQFSRTFEQIKKYLVDGVKAGLAVDRCFIVWMWGDKDNIANGPLAGWRHSPFLQVGLWPDTQSNITTDYPLFTIANSSEYGEPWNETVWAKYRVVWALKKVMGIKQIVSVISQCSDKEGRYYPFANNLQHHGAEGAQYPNTYTRTIDNLFGDKAGTIGKGYGAHTGGLAGGLAGDNGSMKDLILLLYKKMYNELVASGVEFEIQVGNEINFPINPSNPNQDTQEKVDKLCFDWHDNIISYLIGLGCPANKISISLAGTHLRERTSIALRTKYPGLIEELHGPNSPETLRSFLTSFPGTRPDGDGFDRKAEGHTNIWNYGMPSIPQCSEMYKILVEFGIEYFMIFNGWIEDVEPANIELAQWQEQKALAGMEV